MSTKKIIPVLNKYGVLFAFLYGSRATGRSGADSDFDLAVYLPDRLSKNRRFAIRLKLIGEIGRAIGAPDKVDLIILNDTASVLLKFTIVKQGKLIVQKDSLARLNFEMRALSAYYDFSPFINAYNEAFAKKVLSE